MPRFPFVFLAALLAALFGSIMVAPLGLAVPTYLIVPLALGFGALLAALAAAWVATTLADDGTGSQIAPTLGVALLATVLMGGLVALGRFVLGDWVFPNLFARLLVNSAVVALAAALAALTYRDRTRRLRRDALLTVSLLGGALALMVLSIGVVCSIESCTP